MPTSSAEPARLLDYPSSLVQPDAELTSLATELDGAMDAFVSGGGAFVPGTFDADWPGTFVRGLRDESLHLGGYVRQVGQAFVDAGVDADGDGLYAADDLALVPRIGEPTIAEARAEADGQAAARHLRDALIAAGLDPDHFDPAQLTLFEPRNPHYRPIFDALVGVAGQMWSEDYAAGFYGTLGAEGTHLVLGLIDTYAARGQDRGWLVPDTSWQGNVGDRLLEPFVTGWARATNSPELVDERAAMLATEDSVDQRHLALLMSGNPLDYDPKWLAAGAERILVTGEDLNRSQYPTAPALADDEYPGFWHTGWLYDDPGLGMPEVVALRALDGNTAAAWEYVTGGDANVDALVHPPGLRLPNDTLNHDEYVSLFYEIDEHSSGVIQDAFLRAQYETIPDPNDPARRIPLVDPSRDAAAYNDFMEVMAEGHTSDLMRRAAASTLLPHLEDIATAANRQAETPGIETDVLFERKDVVGFFKEIGYDEEAAGIAGHELGLWSGAETTQLFADHPHPTPGELNDTYDPIAQVIGAAYAGFNETEAAAAAANSHFAYGISHGASVIADLTPGVVALLSANPVTAAGTLAIGVGVDVVQQAALFGIEDIRGADTNLPFGGEDLQRQVVTSLRAQAVHQLESTGATPPGTPPGQYSGALADYFGGADPYDELNQSSFVNAFNYGADDPW
jgi:hypothetical protein